MPRGMEGELHKSPPQWNGGWKTRKEGGGTVFSAFCGLQPLPTPCPCLYATKHCDCIAQTLIWQDTSLVWRRKVMKKETLPIFLPNTRALGLLSVNALYPSSPVTCSLKLFCSTSKIIAVTRGLEAKAGLLEDEIFSGLFNNMLLD